MITPNATLHAAAHSRNRKPQWTILVDDIRLRGWNLRHDAGGADEGQLSAAVTNNDKILKAWNEVSTNTLHYGLFSAVTSPTVGNVTGEAMRNRGGVSVYSDHAAKANWMDVLYVGNGLNIRLIRSTDNGTSFGAPTTVVTLEAQQGGKTNPQISQCGRGGSDAPAFFVSSGPPSLGQTLMFYETSTGLVRCPMGRLDMLMQVAQPPVSQLGAFSTGGSDFHCLLYIKNPRNIPDSGIWQISYLDGIWSGPFPVHTHQLPIQGSGNYNVSHPQYVKIGSTHWVFATEQLTVPDFDGGVVQHLIGIPSSDGIHWGKPIPIAGTDMPYDTTVPFSLFDFRNARVIAKGENTYLIAYRKLFQASTPSPFENTEAADWSSKLLDISTDVRRFSISEPHNAGATATITLSNSLGQYDAQPIMREGARIRIAAGYKTNPVVPSPQRFEGRITNVRNTVIAPSRTRGMERQLVVTAVDTPMRNLSLYRSDRWIEYASGQTENVPKLADMSTVIQAQGAWGLKNSEIQGLAPAKKTTLTPPCNIWLANISTKPADAIFEARGRFLGSLAKAYMGIVFRYIDNLNFMAFVYNFKEGAVNQLGNWALLEFRGTATPTVIQTTGSPDVVAGEIWWMRVITSGTKIYCYACKADANGRPSNYGAQILTSTLGGANNGQGYWGGIGKSKSLTTNTVSNNQGNFVGDYDFTADLHLAQRFTAPQNGKLSTFSVRVGAVGAAPGTLNFRILPDDVGNNRPQGTASYLFAKDGVNPASMDNSLYQVQVDPPLTVTAGTNYWIEVAHIRAVGDPYPDAENHNFAPMSDNPNFLTARGGDGTLANWFDIGWDQRMYFQVDITKKGGSVGFSAYSIFTGDPVFSMDYLARDVAAKFGILKVRPDWYFTNDGTTLANFQTGSAKGTWELDGNGNIQVRNTASTYSFIRQKDNSGNIADVVYEFDMTFLDANARAGALLAVQGNVASTVTGYAIEFDCGGNLCYIYACKNALPGAGNRIFAGAPLTNFVQSRRYRVQVIHTKFFITVYIDGQLTAGAWHKSPGLNKRGYVGLMAMTPVGVGSGTPVARFDNINVADLGFPKDYYVVESNQQGIAALNNLFKYRRVKFYGDYDGALRYSRMDRATFVETVQDSFQATLYQSDRDNSDRSLVNHIRSYGDENVERYSGTLLEQLGEFRFQEMDYTDSRSVQASYHQGAFPLREGREHAEAYVFRAAYCPYVQREDRIEITNTRDGTTSKDYLVDSMEIEGGLDPDPFLDMTVTSRLFVTTDAENA